MLKKFTYTFFILIFTSINSNAQSEVNCELLNSLPIKNGWDLCEYKNYVYISNDKHIFVIDANNLGDPIIIDSIQTDGAARGMYIDKELLFLADGTNGVNIYDLSVPSEPQLLTNYHVEGETYDVLVKDHILYTTEWVTDNWTWSRILLFDISDINQKLLIHSYNKPHGMMLTNISGNENLFCVSEMYSVNVFEYSDLDTLRLISKIDFGYGISQFHFTENYLFVANSGNGLRIIDLYNPFSPTELGNFKIQREINGVYADNKYCYIGVNFDHPRILDIDDLANPTQIGHTEKINLSYNYSNHNYTGIISKGDIFYILDVTEGFYILRNTHGETTQIDQMKFRPREYSLSQNYPNPFNPSTTISYSIPEQGAVQLKVFDILGREVKTLVNKEQTAGSYEVKFDASELNSGIYFYQLKADSYMETKKMVLVK